MADDLEIGVRATGVNETVSALDAVAQAEQAVATAGGQTTQASRAQVQASRALSQQQQAQRRVTEQVANAASQGSAKFSQLGGALSGVGSIVGRMNPELGATVGVLGQMGTAVTGLNGALGPIGVGLGVITGAIGLAGAAMDETTDQVEELRERLDRQREAVENLSSRYETLVTRIRNAREQIRGLFGLDERGDQADVSASDVQSAADRAEASARVVAGLEATQRRLRRSGTLEEIQQNELLLEQARARQNIDDFRLAALRGTNEAQAEQNTLQENFQSGLTAVVNQQERGRQAAAQARADEEAATQRQFELWREEEEFLRQQSLRAKEAENQRELFAEAERNRAGRALAQMRAFFAERAAMIAEEQRGVRNEGDVMGADLDAFRSIGAGAGLAQTEAFRDALHAREDAMRAHQAALRDMEAQGTEWTAEEFNRRVALHQESLSMQREGMRENAQILQGMWSSLGSTVTDAAGQMFKFVISGAEGGSEAFLALLDSFLESTAVQYAIKALAEGAEAVAAAARYDYAAAGQHAAAAALAAGVAVATGVAGAAIQTPSATAGTGGGRPQQVAPTTGSGVQQGGNINLTIYSPNAVTTQREQAEMIAAIMRVGRRAGGGGMRG